jgi:hypothetical protein
MSERGYNAFLDRVRLETFASMKEAMGSGATPEALNDTARFINVATGRGELGKLGEVLKPITDHGLFSPRNTAARFQYLNPVRYVAMSPAARKQALSAMLGHTATVGTVLGIAHASGAQVTLNPTETDFGKIKVVNTRYEVTGGYSVPIKLLARSAVVAADSSLSNEEKLQKVSALAAQFLRNSAAPVPGLASDALFPSLTPPGEKGKSAERRAVDLFVPLFLRDLEEAIRTDGVEGGPKALPAFFGVGVQSYKTGRRSHR